MSAVDPQPLLLFGAGVSHAPLSTPMTVLTGCFGVAVLAFGIAVFRGRHKTAVLYQSGLVPMRDTVTFGAPWLGLVCLLYTLISVLDRTGGGNQTIVTILSVLAMICFAICIMSMFWLPDFLLPEWYKVWRDHGRPAVELTQ